MEVSNTLKPLRPRKKRKHNMFVAHSVGQQAWARWRRSFVCVRLTDTKRRLTVLSSVSERRGLTFRVFEMHIIEVTSFSSKHDEITCYVISSWFQVSVDFGTSCGSNVWRCVHATRTLQGISYQWPVNSDRWMWIVTSEWDSERVTARKLLHLREIAWILKKV